MVVIENILEAHSVTIESYDLWMKILSILKSLFSNSHFDANITLKIFYFRLFYWIESSSNFLLYKKCLKPSQTQVLVKRDAITFNSLNFFQILYWLKKIQTLYRVILGLQQNWQGGIEISQIPLAPAHA